MNDFECPWCAAAIDLAPESSDEQQCLECLTTWSYEDEEPAFAIAA
jgi:hypothetical protein